jgi:hypothetical protein
MVDALQSDNTETANDSWSLASEVSRLSDAIAACDRLCLLSAHSLAQCATKVTKNDGHQSVTFIPSVSRDVRTVDDGEEHPTTSAQCVAALQRLLPVVGRFRLGTQESREPAFHPIERSSLEVFDPRQLRREIGDKLNQALTSLHEPAPQLTNGGVDFRDQTARDILTSTTFKYLHPFTAARILKAIAPSQGMYGNVWWRSLFVVLWFLNRRGGSLRGYPNIQATKCPGTAFLTGQCVDAVVTVLDVFRRRRDRFKRLIELMSDLANIDTVREHISQFSCEGALSSDIFSRGYEFKGRALAPEIQQCIDELALDSALPVTYKRWQEELGTRSKMLNEFCVSIADSFVTAMNREDVSTEHKLIQLVAGNGVAHAKLVRDRVKDIHDIISYKLNPEKGKIGLAPITSHVFDQYKFILPDWICSDDYWSSTRKEVADISTASQDDRHRPFLAILEAHWHRHRDASASAAETVELFSRYLSVVLADFDEFKRHFAGLERSKTEPSDSAELNRNKVRKFLNSFSNSPDHLSFLREQLSRDVETGVRWAEVLTNRHLALAAGGALSQFDPGELSHALRIVCHHDHKIRFNLVLTALETICRAQRPDGAWISQQPFHWTKTGSLSLTLSVETAEAIVSCVNMLLRNPQRYGVSLEECSARLQPVYSALDRFFQWLSGSMQSFSKPAALEASDKPESQPPLYGWCSDRVYEQGRIHSWATAAAIEFLVAFRRLQQERISRLRIARLHHLTISAQAAWLQSRSRYGGASQQASRQSSYPTSRLEQSSARLGRD